MRPKTVQRHAIARMRALRSLSSASRFISCTVTVVPVPPDTVSPIGASVLGSEGAPISKEAADSLSVSPVTRVPWVSTSVETSVERSFISLGIATAGMGGGSSPTSITTTVTLSMPPAAFASAISALAASSGVAAARDVARIFLSGTMRLRPSLQIMNLSPLFTCTAVRSISTLGCMPTALRIIPRNIGLISPSSLAPMSSAAEWSFVICWMERERMR